MVILGDSREAREVAYYFWPREQGVYEPGTFAENLIKTMTHADELNLYKLGRSFPEYALAVSAAKQNGIESFPFIRE